MARYGRFGAAEADRCRIAEAALDRCAVHPDGRVLAGDGVSEGHDRRNARMSRGVLRRPPRVNSVDCSFGTFVGWEWVTEDMVVWAKLATLRAGADIASKRL